MILAPSRQIADLPPYLFAEIDRRKTDLQRKGVRLIDLSIGDPDHSTPRSIVETAAQAIAKPDNHRYPAYSGSQRYRMAVAAYYLRRHSVTLDPSTQVLALIGSKEGIAHLPLAVLNPGDIALVPDPGYPVYRTATQFAGGTPVTIPLTWENRFLPDLSRLSKETLERAKLLFLNYPNNPTGAHATREDLARIVAIAREHSIILCMDLAYSEMTNPSLAPSILEIDGAADIAIEMGTLSKSFNMTGWRVGYAVGAMAPLSWLAKIKTNMDSGVFTAVQEAAAYALDEDRSYEEMRAIYAKRRARMTRALSEAGFTFFPTEGTFYIWVRNPASLKSVDVANALMEGVGIVVTPGVGFGEHGEGFFRISLTASDNLIDEACDRLKTVRF